MKSTIMVQLIQYSKKTRLIIAGSVGLLLLAMLFFYHVIAKNRIISMQNKHSEFILHELNTIQSQLEVFSGNTNNQKQQSMLNTIQAELSALQQSMVALAKASDIQKVSSQIASVKDDVDVKMGDIKQVMMSSSGGKHYLDARALPFRVIAVDVIAGLPYVSVDYSDHVSPLALGDTLAGWRVVAAYDEAGVAEFMNDKNQYVKVVIQG